METWMWRDVRERDRVWDDRGPSYCIIGQGLGCGSIIIIMIDSVKDSGPQIGRGERPILRNYCVLAPLGYEEKEALW